MSKVQAPLPDKLLSAKTVYIENQTGTPSFADEAYEELLKWGRFTVVTDKSKADAVVMLSHVTQQGRRTEKVKDAFGNDKQVLSATRTEFLYFSVIDQASGDLLWSDSEYSNAIGNVPKSLVKRLRKRFDNATKK